MKKYNQLFSIIVVILSLTIGTLAEDCITIDELRTKIDNNEDVTEVNTSCITDMSHLFEVKEDFNQDISAWDVSNVTQMRWMFAYISKFNQNICSWNISNVTDHYNFAYASSLQDSYNPFLNPCITTTYEDAEDQQTTGWRVYDNTPSGATITNVYDTDKQSRVIELSGSRTSNGFLLGGYYKNNTSWNNSTQKSIKWSMKTDKAYYVFVSLDTKKGHRYVYYTNASSDGGKNEDYIHHSLGATSSDGNWHTFTRDLEANLKEYESDNSIIAVEGFLVRGNLRVDDIALISNYTALPDYKVSLVVDPTSILFYRDDSYLNVGVGEFEGGLNRGDIIDKIDKND